MLLKVSINILSAAPLPPPSPPLELVWWIPKQNNYCWRFRFAVESFAFNECNILT